EAAEGGEVLALCSLGAKYWEGKGVIKNLALAAEWFVKAAERADCTDAMLRLGEMYATGSGVAQDAAKAFAWDRRARETLREKAEVGDGERMVSGGVMHEGGRGGPKSDEEAFDWMQKSAAARNALGIRLLGEYYYSGIGVEKNYEQAAHWFLKSAEEGDAFA